jgi:ABC-type Fe3+-citrate transport system substrate-binding protein
MSPNSLTKSNTFEEYGTLPGLRIPSRSLQPQYLSPLTKLSLTELQGLRADLLSRAQSPVHKLYLQELNEAIEAHQLVLFTGDYETQDSVLVLLQLLQSIKEMKKSLRWHDDLLEEVENEIKIKEKKDNEA